MAASNGEYSVIYEGRISRADVYEKLAMRSHLQGGDPLMIAQMSQKSIISMIQMVDVLLSKALHIIRTTHFMWLLHGFECPSDAGLAYGSHGFTRNYNHQIESGRRGNGPGFSISESDISEEQAKIRRDYDKRTAYKLAFEADFAPVRDRISLLQRRGAALSGGRDEVDDNGEDDELQDAADEEHDKDEVYDKLDFGEKVVWLLQEARECHEKLVDIVLAYLPGRTFLKAH